MINTTTERAEQSGTYGAKVTSFAKENGRDLLPGIADAHPHASPEDLVKYLEEAIFERGGGYIDSAIRYFAVNAVNAFVDGKARADRSARPVVKSPGVDRRVVEQLTTNLKTFIDRQVDLILLDVQMPNGKPLRDCTGEECRRAGLRFARIADAVGSDGIVGERLTEDQAREIWDRQ